MYAVSNLDELNLPLSYIEFIGSIIDNVAEIPFVQKVILFGSCATGHIHENSDIDLFIVTDRDITVDEEFKISFECTPDYSINSYIPVDMIIKPIHVYDKYKFYSGMLEKYIELEGVDLGELLSKRRRNI